MTIAMLGPAALTAPAASAVKGPPDSGSRYDHRRDHTGPDGASSMETTSCVGPHGEVYHRRRAATANSAGHNTATTISGNPAACGDGDHQQDDPGRPLIGGRNNPLVNVSTGDINLLSGAGRH